MLVDFLKSWISWVDKGAPDFAPFSRREGLCHALPNWNMRGQLKLLFINDNMNPDYPFGGVAVFERYMYNSTQHLLPARLEWVRKTIKELEGNSK